MKINRAVLTYGVAKTFEENVDFSHDSRFFKYSVISFQYSVILFRGESH